MKSKYDLDYHSCYDELLQFFIKPADNSNKAFLVKKSYFTAQEIVLYYLLLNKCINEQNEEQVITYSELQQLRGKRCGKKNVLDYKTLRAYDKAFVNLGNKTIHYDLGDSRKNRKITYRKFEHPFLIIKKVQKFSNGDKEIYYSLGPFGKTLIESKRYSTLVPKIFFQKNFNEINSLQIAIYICKILFIEQRKKKAQMTITLPSIMNNINKFANLDNYGLINCCVGIDFYGPNVKRFWESIIKKVNETLDMLKLELKIVDYTMINLHKDKNYSKNYNLQDIKWIIELNNKSLKSTTRV